MLQYYSKKPDQEGVGDIATDCVTMNFSDWLDLDESLSLKGSYKGSLFQRLVAAKYVLAPSFDEYATPAFADLAKKIERQSDFLKSKFSFRPTQDDPYPSMKAMSRDIERQRSAGKKPEIPVYAEPPAMDQGQGHPYFTNQQNVTQRGVHDVIAHYFGQHPFSARGEYGAYNRHLKTLCNVEQAKAGQCLAAKAMFTEVVAQTSYYYVYGDYAPQKAIILGDFDHFHVGQLNPKSNLNKYFAVEGKLMVPREGFSYEEFQAEQPQLASEMESQLNGKSITSLVQLPGETALRHRQSDLKVRRAI